MAPCPRPPSPGGASPRRRCIVPCLVPAGTRSFFRPWSVGPSISAPRIASGMVSGTSTSTLSPFGLKTGDGSTWVMTYRAPGGPPRRAGSPLPARRTREPSLTPAGTLTRYFLTVRTAPEPAHVGHGSSMIAPVPPHCEHGWEIENSPWPCDSMPRPWQRGHTRGLVPGLAPVPAQVVHVDDVVTDSGICAPSIACSKLIVTSASRSRPRSGRGRAPAPAPPPRLPKRLLRMSEKPPASKPPAAPPAPPPPPPNGLPPANGFSRWPSYCLRLSGSPR